MYLWVNSASQTQASSAFCTLNLKSVRTGSFCKCEQIWKLRNSWKHRYLLEPRIQRDTTCNFDDESIEAPQYTIYAPRKGCP